MRIINKRKRGLMFLKNPAILNDKEVIIYTSMLVSMDFTHSKWVDQKFA